MNKLQFSLITQHLYLNFLAGVGTCSGPSEVTPVHPDLHAGVHTYGRLLDSERSRCFKCAGSRISEWVSCSKIASVSLKRDINPLPSFLLSLPPPFFLPLPPSLLSSSSSSIHLSFLSPSFSLFFHTCTLFLPEYTPSCLPVGSLWLAVCHLQCLLLSF